MNATRLIAFFALIVVAAASARTFGIGDPSPTLGSMSNVTDRVTPGGRIISIAVAPGEKRVYAGTLHAGLWRSDDGGEHWYQLTRPQGGDDESPCPGGTPAGSCSLPVPMVADVAVSPVDPNLVFVGAALDGRKVERDGVYRSRNGGKTWQLVHQFTCNLDDKQVNQPVGQIEFAPDDPTELWAAGGCTVAHSSIGRFGVRGDVGDPATWADAPNAGSLKGVWHVAVGPAIKGTRAVWACGPQTLWTSTNSGATFVADDGSSDTDGTPGSVLEHACEAPSLQVAGAASASVLVLDPTDPRRAYVAVHEGSNGLVYFGTGAWAGDGHVCGAGGTAACGQGAVWSISPSGAGFVWRQEPAPPVFPGAGTRSGAVALVTQPRVGSHYLLFFVDTDSLDVAVGPPTTRGWHRLDGPNIGELCMTPASSTCNSDNTAPQGIDGTPIHPDPHAIAFSPDLSLTLVPTRAAPPYDATTDIAKCSGRLFLGNDGGLYRSEDCGRHWAIAEDLKTLITSQLAALPSHLHAGPALYFGGPDQDTHYSPNGGASWLIGEDQCGDCAGYFGDPLAPTRVIHQRRPGDMTLSTLELWRSSDAEPPDVSGAAPATLTLPPDDTFNDPPADTLRPVVLGLPGETASDFDLVWTGHAGGGTQVYRYRGLAWEQQGPSIPNAIGAVVQAAGGHEATVFYVADRASREPDQQFLRLWRSHEEGGIVTGWDCIVPGPLNPGVDDGLCAVPATTLDPDGSTGCAAESVCRAFNFSADPYDPKLVYISDYDGIKVSTDGGVTWRVDDRLDSWLSEDGAVGPMCKWLCQWADTMHEFEGMTFVPGEPTRFAFGEAGVFASGDGRIWHRLLDSSALACLPGPGAFDDAGKLGRVLYVPCHGRSLLALVGIPTAGELGLDVRLHAPNILQHMLEKVPTPSQALPDEEAPFEGACPGSLAAPDPGKLVYPYAGQSPTLPPSPCP
jgi:hypothetical protein